jgi:hypothetical protein
MDVEKINRSFAQLHVGMGRCPGHHYNRPTDSIFSGGIQMQLSKEYQNNIFGDGVAGI